MSAIDTTFHFVRNPTAINGLATTYVSKRGSDVSGDGTAQNPYASLAKATSVATANTNIMLDDGEWNEDRTNNNKFFSWWGNANTKCKGLFKAKYNEKYYFLFFQEIEGSTQLAGGVYFYCYNCFLFSCFPRSQRGGLWAENCVVINPKDPYYRAYYDKCVIVNHTHIVTSETIKNSILVNSVIHNGTSLESNFNNFTTTTIPNTGNRNSINNTTTGQTLTDYFNYVQPNIITNPLGGSLEEFLQCDFTAKEGSKNIGAGEKGTNIGLNQGYTIYADNSANDVFKESNGATLKNIAWDSTLNGYTLVQKERICQGATSTTITLDSSASVVDDYYNNLFIGIVSGDGYGELFLITDYDGATKTATIDGSWNTTPNTNSIYTISGTILSAVKDLGKAIKVKRNWTFSDNFTALQDGQWAEFMTHVETNGKQFPVSCYSYEYSTDGVNFVQGQTADDLVSATNGENKVTDAIYGDCSANYNEATAKNLVMRYIRVRVHIGFNIGN